MTWLKDTLRWAWTGFWRLVWAATQGSRSQHAEGQARPHNYAVMTLRSDFTGPTGIHIMASRPVEVWVSPTKSPNDASHYYGVTTAGYIEMPRQPGPWYVICAVPKDCAYYSDLEIIAQPLCPW